MKRRGFMGMLAAAVLMPAEIFKIPVSPRINLLEYMMAHPCDPAEIKLMWHEATLTISISVRPIFEPESPE